MTALLLYGASWALCAAGHLLVELYKLHTSGPRPRLLELLSFVLAVWSYLPVALVMSVGWLISRAPRPVRA